MKINTVIIEDEYHSAQALETMLREYCPDVTIIGIFSSVADAVIGLPHLNPDLIFMDIMMPDGTAFEILEKFRNKKIQIVFTTAYDNYALRAIKFSAIDYLLKPISIEDLKKSIHKVQEARIHLDENRLESLISNLKPLEKLQRIAFPTADGHSFAFINEIIRFEAEGSYSKIYLVGMEKYLISRPMKEYEQILLTEGFFRVHYSHLINLLHVKKYIRGNGGFAVMSDGAKVDVASRRKDEFLKALQII